MIGTYDDRISLRLLFFNLWIKKRPNDPINHRKTKKKQKTIHEIATLTDHLVSPSLSEYAEQLADEFAKTKHPIFTPSQLFSTFTRLETIFNRAGHFPDLFSTPIKYLGFLIFMPDSSVLFDPPTPEHSYYNLKKNHKMSFSELETLLTAKALTGQIIKTEINDFADSFETYYYDPRSERASFGFLRRTAMVRFDFLSYKYNNDLTVTEREKLPTWASNLITRMNVVNTSLPYEINCGNINVNQHFAVIVLKNAKTNVTRARFWTVLDDERNFVSIKMDLQAITFERNDQAISGNLKHILNNCVALGEPFVFNALNYCFKITLLETGLSPLDDVVTIRMKDLLRVFQEGQDIQVIGNKGVGKSEIGKRLSVLYPSLLVVDSDDYGKFLVLLLNLVPSMFKNSEFEVDEIALTNDLYFQAMADFISLKQSENDNIDSIFEHIMEGLIEPNTLGNGDIQGEAIMDSYNRIFHYIQGSKIVGYRRFITEYVRLMYTNFNKNQTCHFVHSYCELAFVPHSLAYITLHSSYNSAVIGILPRNGQSVLSPTRAIANQMLHSFYERYTSNMNPTPAFLFSYFFGLTKGINPLTAVSILC
ncbi:P8 [Southern rice black-streaked dwarf virus]|uniref:p8 n=2 Tax=Southern rice black-streaked dwarf virus TaxID=519497 RepID=E4WKX3_9REOV|nr:P8 [Southern rice black-streaked dwarf virus]CBH31260.1 P8 [Southern rice black-streaked dwarf virus]